MTTLAEWKTARRTGQPAGGTIPSEDQRAREAAAETAGTEPPANDPPAGDGGDDEAPQLTEAERAAAKVAGMSPERYASLRTTTSLGDWQAGRSTKVEVTLSAEDAEALRRDGQIETTIKV